MFEDKEVKVRTDKGKVLINLTSTARVCGLVRTVSGKEYIDWKGKSGVVSKLSKIIEVITSKETIE